MYSGSPSNALALLALQTRWSRNKRAMKETHTVRSTAAACSDLAVGAGVNNSRCLDRRSEQLEQYERGRNFRSLLECPLYPCRVHTCNTSDAGYRSVSVGVTKRYGTPWLQPTHKLLITRLLVPVIASCRPTTRTCLGYDSTPAYWAFPWLFRCSGFTPLSEPQKKILSHSTVSSQLTSRVGVGEISDSED